MRYPSGNEDIQRSYQLSRLIFTLWSAIVLAGLAWFDLARAAASYRPGWGGNGLLGVVLTGIARSGDVRRWIGAIAQDQAIAWPFWYAIGRPLGHPPSPALWTWIYRASYASAHAIGAPPVYMGIMWNLVLFVLLASLPPLLVTRARGLGSGRSVDARIGTAHWPAPAVLRPYIRAAARRGSLPLGQIARGLPGAGSALALPLRDPEINVGRFSHAAIWGVSEAGKTSAVFKPWLFSDLSLNNPSRVDGDGWPTAAMSSVVIDMKHPDIYTDLAPYAAVLPRRLLLLAPGDPERSLHYNPLDFVQVASGSTGNIDDLAALADAIILNTPEGYKDDQFHQGRERELLKLLIWYVCDVQDAIDRGAPTVAGVAGELAQLIRPVLPPGAAIPPIRSFPMVAAMVHLAAKKLLGVIQATVTDPQRPEDWQVRLEQVAELKKTDDFTNWLGGLQRRLAVFTSPGVAALSSRSDFSLDLVGRQPSTLVVGMPRLLTKALEPYSALIVTQLLQQLKRVAAGSPTHRLSIPVTLYLDELPAEGRIPFLEHEIATLRDMAVGFVCGMQSTAALEGKYGRQVGTSITSNTNTKIVIGRNLGLEDARYFSELAGETTILTPGASEGGRGGTRTIHTARRPLVTPDQIRRMPQFQALVFIQTGHPTQACLPPFHETGRDRAGVPRDLRFATGGRTADGAVIHPVVYLRHRQAELDRVLGPWDTRPKRALPKPPAGGAGASPAVSTLAAAPQRARGVIGGIAESLALEAEAEPAGALPGEAHGEPSEAAGAVQNGESVSSHILAQKVEERRPSPPLHDPGAVSDLAGFFDTLVRGRIAGSLDRGSSPGWWVRLAGGDHVLVRWALARAFGELRRTKAREIAERWQRAGFVVPRRLSVAGPDGRISVLAFTPAAVRRLTPAVTDVLGAWPRLSVGEVQGLELNPASPDAVTPQSRLSRTSRDRSNDALMSVVAWARANETALRSGASQESGQWEALVQGEPVLLVRQPTLNRILLRLKFDLRAIMMAWRDAGVIVAEEKRFTVYTRVDESEQQGARFVAFRWSRLEAAGLSRN